MVFRGSHKDFLRYIELECTDKNIQMIKDALTELKERNFINYQLDTTTEEDYFVASIYRKTEIEMKIGIDMIKTCKEIADSNNKREWIPLLKTWVGMQIMTEEQPFTLARLREVTGLSDYQLRQARVLLEKNDLFRTSKAYENYFKCKGLNIELNGFFN